MARGANISNVLELRQVIKATDKAREKYWALKSSAAGPERTKIRTFIEAEIDETRKKFFEYGSVR